MISKQEIEAIKEAMKEGAKDWFSKKMIEDTLKYQKKYSFKLGALGHETHNSEADAFKHAYMQWLISASSNKDFARNLGDKHEYRNNYSLQELKERNMDLWNNSIGREISELVNIRKYPLLSRTEISDLAAAEIVKRIRSGELITDPNDSRKFENMELERLTDKDRIHYRDEFVNLQEPLNDDIIERYLEQAIDNNWTIPEKVTLDKRVKTGELIFVDSYKKADGTEISGYYRRKPVK